MEKTGKFDFDIQYVPRVDNLWPDALSRLFVNDAPGTVRSLSEYVQCADTGADAALAKLWRCPTRRVLTVMFIAAYARTRAYPKID